MSADDLCYLDAWELAARVRAKELSPVEIVSRLRTRAEALNGKLNALVTPFPDVEDRARAAEAAVLRGDELGPLHGVPFTIKDTFDSAGVRTTRGSRLFADRVPDRDATVVARLKVAGGIPLAKTNSPEFALWWETDNLVFGQTPNPWDPERTAGGSSGGEAAAISAGLSPFGIGSDLGGSIRLPAHYCGVAGLKPTHGRVPLTGHFPDVLHRFMHAGFLARSVRDVALALSVTSGPDGEDWYALAVPAPEVPEARERLGLRVGLVLEGAFGAVAEEVAAVVRSAGDALEQVGCTVEPAAVPALSDVDWNRLTMVLYSAGSGGYFDSVIDGRHGELHSALRQRLSTRITSLEDYVAAEHAVEELRRGVASFFRHFDLMLCPTGLVTAYAHGADEIAIDGELHPPRAVMRATIPFDLTGSPALSVPFGSGARGLPVGVQLVGRQLDEPTVFTAGMALERARHAELRPPV